jgi:hypothetical protein
MVHAGEDEVVFWMLGVSTYGASKLTTLDNIVTQ